MKASDLIRPAVSAKKVLQYTHKQHRGFRLDDEILKHPQWQLRSVPLSQLHIPDPEPGEVESDPYDRVQWMDMDAVEDIDRWYIQNNPIVVDSDGWIIDGNHRALAARLSGMKEIPAWVPVSAVREGSQGMKFLRPGELRGSYSDTQLRAMGFRQARNGAWFISQRRWDQLTQSGQLREQQLDERVSGTLYHYTNIYAALKIIQSGKFELSSTLGTDVESQYAPRGYPYFLSATRTRTGGYHDYVGGSAVMFVLDGDWFNSRYPGGAVDYWNNRNPLQSHHRRHEAEDRIFSRERSIPIDGVRALHVLAKPDADPQHRAWARQLIILAKQQSLPVYLYNDADAWRAMDTRKTVKPNYLTGQDAAQGRGTRGHRGYLMPWMELIFGQDRSSLSKRAQSVLYALNYQYDRGESVKSLSVDLSNARKPSSGPDRENAVKIISYMRKNRLSDLAALADHVRDRWKATNENFADGKKPGRKGLAKRMGVPTKASVSKLRKIAQSSSGEKQRMAHWLANMKRGRARKNK